MLTITERPATSSGGKAFRLPPLILHPFSSPEDTKLLMESSRASLVLQGFLQDDKTPAEELLKTLLLGRYAEMRMLFYIGKDLIRWTEQCAEMAAASPLFSRRRVTAETFICLLVENVPGHVKSKLEAWGVVDHCALFRRSIGFHWVFGDLPASSALQPDFLRRYHRHLDQWYEQRLQENPFSRAEPGDFFFDLYASGEYTMMLEQSWSQK